MVGTVVCWEADHSDSEWYRKLNAAMEHGARLAADLAFDVGSDAMNELIGQLPGFSQYADMLFWIENIALIVQGLINWLRNKDDKVAEHNYGFTKGFLEGFMDIEAYIQMMFDGGSGGQHAISARVMSTGVGGGAIPIKN